MYNLTNLQQSEKVIEAETLLRKIMGTDYKPQEISCNSADTVIVLFDFKINFSHFEDIFKKCNSFTKDGSKGLVKISTGFIKIDFFNVNNSINTLELVFKIQEDGFKFSF